MKHATGDIDWSKVYVQARIGMTTAEARNVHKLCTFVQHWSGGDDGQILKQLESFEKLCTTNVLTEQTIWQRSESATSSTLGSYRHFHKARMRGASSSKGSHELLALDTASFFIRLLWPCGLSIYRRSRLGADCKAATAVCMQGIIKAMLQSPTADQGGFSDVFSLNDLHRLKSREKNLMARVQAADDAIEKMLTFMKAYGKFSEADYSRLSNMMEVRAVMLAWNKKVGTRATYGSQDEVMYSIFLEAKSVYPQLPDMPALAEVARRDAKTAHVASNIVEIGKVENNVLERKGFKVGAVILTASARFKITCLNADMKHVTMVAYDDEKEEFGTVTETIPRTDLAVYTVEPPREHVFYTDFPCASANLTLLKNIIQGAVSQALLKEFLGSSEKHCQVSGIGTTLLVTTKKKISEQKLVLVPLTTSVLVSEKPLAKAGLPIGTAELGSLELKIYIRSSNTQLLSSTEKTRKDAFVAMYWILEKTMTGDARKANCELATYDLEVSVGKEKISVRLPRITNVKALQAEDRLVVLSPAVPVEVAEPPQKRKKTRK